MTEDGGRKKTAGQTADHYNLANLESFQPVPSSAKILSFGYGLPGLRFEKRSLFEQIGMGSKAGWPKFEIREAVN
jgi:hypothetical protein